MLRPGRPCDQQGSPKRSNPGHLGGLSSFGSVARERQARQTIGRIPLKAAWFDAMDPDAFHVCEDLDEWRRKPVKFLKRSANP